MPLSYNLTLNPCIEDSQWNGTIIIPILWKKESKIIELHAHQELEVDETKVQLFIRSADNK